LLAIFSSQDLHPCSSDVISIFNFYDDTIILLLALRIVEYVLYGHTANVLSFICFKNKIQSYQSDDVKVVHCMLFYVLKGQFNLEKYIA